MRKLPTNPILILGVVIALVSFSGCSERGGENPSAPRNTPQSCRDAHGDNGLSQAAVIDPGIQLAPTKPHTRLRLWHLPDGTRKACIIEGNVTSDE